MHPANRRNFPISATLVLFIVATFAFAARPAAAQREFLLASVGTTQGSIKGTSTVKGHEGWLELHSAEIGNLPFTSQNSANISAATSGAGGGKVKFNEFIIHKTIDRASPSLFQAATGHTFSQITIECLSGSPMQPQTSHRLIITGGTMSVKADGPGKEAIIFVGGHVSYH